MVSIEEIKERVCLSLPVSTNRKLSELAKARHTTRSAIVASLVEGDFEAEGGGIALGKLDQLRTELLEPVYACLALCTLFLPDYFRGKSRIGFAICDLGNSELADLCKDVGSRMVENGGNLGMALADAVESLPADAPHAFDFKFTDNPNADKEDFVEACRYEGQRFEDWRANNEKEAR